MALTRLSSLGPRLSIDGRQTPIPLPSVLFEHLPALDGFQSGRFALFPRYVCRAGMFAIGIDRLWILLRRSRYLRQLSPGWNMVGRAVTVGAVAVAVTLPLVPSHAQPTSATKCHLFHIDSRPLLIPPGSVVLAYPYPDLASSVKSYWAPFPSVMLYQAVAGMRFELFGGYGFFRVARLGKEVRPVLLC